MIYLLELRLRLRHLDELSILKDTVSDVQLNSIRRIRSCKENLKMKFAKSAVPIWSSFVEGLDESATISRIVGVSSNNFQSDIECLVCFMQLTNMASPPLFARRKFKGPRRDPKATDGGDDGEPVVVRKPLKASAPRNNTKPHLAESSTPQPVETPSPPPAEESAQYIRAGNVEQIPSTAEIEEAKARRARKAQEANAEDFIALEDYDSDGEFRPQRMQVSKFLDKSSEKDTRLVRDDEDIAEGFEAFVDDPGKVTLSRKAKREQERTERENMRSMIEEAEDSSDESDSSAERNYAYETAQTSRGMDGLSLKQKQNRRPQQPKEITPIPKLAAVLARFREGIQGLEYERAKLQKRRADIEKEKAEIASREENIQRLLAETGERFERLRREAEEPVNGNGHERGLESIGTPVT